MDRLRPLALVVGGLLKQRRETVGVVESSAGGLLSAALLAVPGASAYFIGGGVIYTNAARAGLLGIDLADHPGMRSSSEPYALLAARTIRQRLNATWGLCETGASGPKGNRYGDPAGHTCIGVAGPVERAATLRTGHADREENMIRFAERALDAFRAILTAG
jgi:PncC family amidohydrolase